MKDQPNVICTGFEVTIVCHTQTALDELDPDRIRYAVGKALDASKLIEEEIDYTLVIRRLYKDGMKRGRTQ